jgi:hypothetical protein
LFRKKIQNLLIINILAVNFFIRQYLYLQFIPSTGGGGGEDAKKQINTSQNRLFESVFKVKGFFSAAEQKSLLKGTGQWFSFF